MPTTEFYAGQKDYVRKLNDLWDRASVALVGTSASAVAVGTGSKAFATDTSRQWTAGDVVRVKRTSAPSTTYMVGTITSYNAETGSLVVNATESVGSGTFTDWTITITGEKGEQGLKGDKGDKGDTGDVTPALQTLHDDAVAANTAAQAAKTSAETAEVNAEAAATEASARVAEAAAHANTASNAAGNVVLLVDDAEAAKVSAENSAASAATSADIATAKVLEAQAAIVNVAAAEEASTEAQTALAGTASAAAQAANARDQAIAAWAASTAPAEQLAAMSQSIHSGAIVDAFLYDTSKDSDSGAWRKRTMHTSWYNEAINGVWLGQKANELAARGDNLVAHPEGTITDGAPPFVVAVTNATVSITGYANSIQFGDNSTLRQFQRSATQTLNKLHIASALVQMDDNSAPVPSGAGSQSTGDFSCIAGAAIQAATVTATTHPNVYRVTWLYTPTAQNGVGINKYTGQSAKGFRVTAIKTNLVGEQSSTYSGSPELVANGGFDAGTSGWTISTLGTSSVTVANGVATLTGDGTNAALLGQGFQTVAGKVYVVQFDVGLNSQGIRLGTALNDATNLATTSFSVGRASVAFTATATTTWLTFIKSATAGSTVDNVSIKEVTTLATPYVPYSALAGQYYQNTTDGKFYSLNATYGQTETFRGNKREFPALAGIVAESTRVVIYDMATGAMWMVFTAANAANWWASGSTVTSLATLNGSLMVGSSGGGARLVDFVQDRVGVIHNVAGGVPQGAISLRNTAPVWAAGSRIIVVSPTINDITATVLQGAPVDPATGLPVPTIVTHTAGGVSVIRDNGTVANHAFTGSSNDNVALANGVLYYGTSTLSFGFRAISVKDITGSSFTGAVVGGNGSTMSWRAGRVCALGGTSIATATDGTNTGLSLSRANLATPANSMRAVITNAYNSGWQVGDSRGAWLCDTVAEVIAGTTVLSDTFDYADTAAMLAAGWVAYNGATIEPVAGRIRVTTPGGVFAMASKAMTCEIGRSYTVVADAVHTNVTLYLGVGTTAVNITSGNTTRTSSGQVVFNFTATATTHYLSLYMHTSATAAQYIEFDNISVKLASPDRSVKNNGMVVVGSLSKTPVAANASLVGFSGFSAANYLEQPYNSNLDFGTGDFCVMGWFKQSLVTQNLPFFLREDGTTRNVGIIVTTVDIRLYAASNSQRLTYAYTPPVDRWVHVAMVRRSGTLVLCVDGVEVSSVADATNVTNAAAVTRIGYGVAGSINTAQYATLALIKVGGTAPSADQIAMIYRTELAMFQPNAKVTIDGTSTAVTALAFDEDAELLHVGTSWGRSAFSHLVRVESNPTSVGALTAIAAGGGAHISAGATAARMYQPAMLLRDELKRRAEARKALGKEPVFFEFDSVTSQTDFPLPKGYIVKAVYAAGTLKREGTTKDYTLVDDGFKVTVKFNVAPANATWVSVMAVRV